MIAIIGSGPAGLAAAVAAARSGAEVALLMPLLIAVGNIGAIAPTLQVTKQGVQRNISMQYVALPTLPSSQRHRYGAQNAKMG